MIIFAIACLFSLFLVPLIRERNRAVSLTLD